MLPPEIAQMAASGVKAPAGPSVADEKAQAQLFLGTFHVELTQHFLSCFGEAALKEKGLYFQQGSGPDLNALDDAYISTWAAFAVHLCNS